MTLNALADLVTQAEAAGVSLHEIVLRDECAESNQTRAQIWERMAHRLDVMRASVQQGLAAPVYSLSGLSGGNAYRFQQWRENHTPLCGPLLSRAVAYALAVTEVNAAMGCIVAAPTAGASGVLPGAFFALQEEYALPDDVLVRGLFTAAGVGMVIARRAMISGAAGGCQAEVGSAAAMTAAAVAEMRGGTPRQAAHAAALTLKGLLGLVCDPVAGLVEVPCVKRNTAGVAQCFVAVDLALAGIESVIPPDEVIDAMGQVGRMLDERLKETGQGGVAATPTGKAWASRLRSAWE